MRRILLTLLIGSALVSTPRTLEAQWTSVGGGVLGAGGGVLLAHAIVTGEARGGRYIYEPSDGYLRLIPVPIGALAGVWLGAENGDRLWRSVGHGAVGMATGGIVGAVLGDFVWGDSEGRWAGGVLGAATGLLIGSIEGFSSWSSDSEPIPLFSLRLPVGR